MKEEWNDMEQDNIPQQILKREDGSFEYPELIPLNYYPPKNEIEWQDIRDKQPKEGAQVYFLSHGIEFKGTYDGFLILQGMPGEIQHQFSGNGGGFMKIMKSTDVRYWRPRLPTEGRITCTTFKI